MVVRALPVLELPKCSGSHVVLEVEDPLLAGLDSVAIVLTFLVLLFLGSVPNLVTLFIL